MKNEKESLKMLQDVYTEFQNRFPRQRLPDFSLDAKVLGPEGLFDSLTIAEFLLTLEEKTSSKLLDAVVMRGTQQTTTMRTILELIQKG